jgi:GNAT superfamily N-acetyltransferase
MECVSLADRPDLIEAAFAFGYEDDEAFMQHDETGLLWSECLPTVWASWSFVFFDGPDIVARAFTVPFAWYGDELPSSGLDGVLREASVTHAKGVEPNTLAALEITVDAARRGQGRSAEVLRAVIGVAGEHGIAEVVCPVRPNEKANVPMVPIEDYIAQVRDDGLPIDPWLRTHVRAGGKIVGVAPFSMVIHGSLAQWREWTGMAFDVDGPTIVRGALYPVDVSVSLDRAIYVEPNVWVRHRVPAAASAT